MSKRKTKKTVSQPIQTEFDPKIFKYKMNDIVEVHTWGQYYPAKLLCAKVIKNTPKSKGICQYYVHYQKWPKRWDEWIDESKIKGNDNEINGNKDDGKPILTDITNNKTANNDSNGSIDVIKTGNEGKIKNIEDELKILINKKKQENDIW
mmetsp:Transcript_86618/g.106292  ORF Transcript_86618/g.106292 Transcript_86618/m.106292 type:complete len:150 (+) Transcript_86618:19-468(+)